MRLRYMALWLILLAAVWGGDAPVQAAPLHPD